MKMQRECRMTHVLCVIWEAEFEYVYISADGDKGEVKLSKF